MEDVVELSAMYHLHILNDFKKTLRHKKQIKKSLYLTSIPAINFCLFSFKLSCGKYFFLPFITGEGDKQ